MKKRRVIDNQLAVTYCVTGPWSILSINYSELIPVLIQSIKEQQEQISRLTLENQRLNKLETELSELKKIVGKLSSDKK
jgi:hypothetical protein